MKTVTVDETQFKMLERLMEFCKDMCFESEEVEDEGGTKIDGVFMRDLRELVHEYQEYLGPEGNGEAH